ncbi:mucin-16-like [Diceros bicornis minor]|uniref:mucin-16-like n=1 Tax=Diceros bicornis minor TaxID=77932 RepID=UPI0026F08A9D|nr:mucin-16-like [Diceros bicornis minor]XP_058394139.1 mucin-16-like [Diceros bicornis minor]
MGKPAVWTPSAPTILTPWATMPLCWERRVSTCLLFLSVAPGSASQSLSIQREHQLRFHIISWNLSNPEPTSSEYTVLLRDTQDQVTKLYRGSQL